MSGLGENRSPRDIRQQDTGQSSSSSGRDHGRRLVAMMTESAEIDKEELGGDYSKCLSKQERLHEIKTRFETAQSYINKNLHRIENTRTHKEVQRLVTLAQSSEAKASDFHCTK